MEFYEIQENRKDFQNIYSIVVLNPFDMLNNYHILYETRTCSNSHQRQCTHVRVYTRGITRMQTESCELSGDRLNYGSLKNLCVGREGATQMHAIRGKHEKLRS